MSNTTRDAASVDLDVRTYPIDNPRGSTLAYASVNVDGLVAISGIRIVDSEKGPFVAMPQQKDNKNEYRDVAFPILPGLRGRISEEVMESYAAAMEKAAPEKASVRDQIKQNAKAKPAQAKPAASRGAKGR
jgi:stage V sporulation protein G